MSIDYTVYSIAELQEALRSVDGTTYPENKAAIEAELAARKASGEYDRDLDRRAKELVNHTQSRFEFAKKMRVAIAWYLIMAPIITLANINFQADVPSMGVLAVLVIVFATFFVASHSAGIGLLKHKPWAHRLAISVLAVQVLSLQSDTLVVQFLSLVGIFVTFGAGGDIGIWATFSPGVQLFADTGMPFQLGVNVLAIAAIYFLLESKDADDVQESPAE